MAKRLAPTPQVAGEEGAGALHHRGDEDDVRDRVRRGWGDPRYLAAERPAGGVRRAAVRHPSGSG